MKKLWKKATSLMVAASLVAGMLSTVYAQEKVSYKDIQGHCYQAEEEKAERV